MIDVNWWNADTGEELDDWHFPQLEVRPCVGDALHYWQDATLEAAVEEGSNRHDYVVTKVEHDLRFMPRPGQRSKYIHMLNVWLREVSG